MFSRTLCCTAAMPSATPSPTDVIFDGQQVLIAVAAGDAEQRSAHQHVRSGHLARVDGVAQVDIDEAACADIAHGGEPGHQGGARIDHAVDGFFGVGLRQFAVGIEVGVHGEVGVHVDQPGHHRHPAQVDHLISRLRGNRGGGAMDGMVSPTTTMVWPSSSLPVFTSSRCPARTSVRGALVASCAKTIDEPSARHSAAPSFRRKPIMLLPL